MFSLFSPLTEVPIRKEVLVDDFSMIAGIAGIMSSPNSVAGSHRGGSTRSSIVSRTQRSTGGTAESTSESGSGKIIELDDELDFSDNDSTANMFKLLQKAVSPSNVFYNQ
jgi:hypothetical protein